MSKLRAIPLILGLFVIGGLFCGPYKAFSQEKVKDKSMFKKMIRLFPPLVPVDTVNVYVIGDVMLHKSQMDKEYGPFLEDLSRYACSADVSVANMEFPLGGKPYTGYPSFSAPTDYADYVASMGFDVFLAANNHIMDRGTPGLDKTLDYYAGMKGVRFTGAANKTVADSSINPLIINAKGIKIALVNFTYGFNTGGPEEGRTVHMMKKEDVAEMMARAKAAGAHFIIALPHWGEEYVLKHNSRQGEWAKWLAEEGADVVVGSHPHVVQDTTYVKTKDGRKVPVVYSLGNAVSNMSLINTRLELAATISLSRTFLGEVKFLGIHLDWLWCTLPGKLTDSYKTVVIKEYEGKRDLWKDPSDYDNMIESLKRVAKATGIGK
ncbi:MAG: CapA family protein [Bacteroidales bacterium]|nr:CapA family protein [Bacteroidales bacterium]